LQDGSNAGIYLLLRIFVDLSAIGCRQDMHDQPKFFPQRGTAFFADGRSVRPQIEGTVARSQGDAGSYFLTGMVDGKEGDMMPLPTTVALLARGQERYNIYCSPCHSRVGNGLGMIVQRGYYAAADFHTTRLRDAPLGHFFNVITNGYGAMPDYAAQLAPEDRWAVAAYVRALQLSQNARPADLNANARVEKLDDVAEREGLSKGFLAAWYPRTSPTVMAAVKAPEATTAILTPPLPETPAAPGSTKVPTPREPQSANPENAVAPKKSPTPVPEKAAPKRDVAAGHEIYTHNCQVCHQPARTGIPPNIPALIGIVDKVGEDRIRFVVTNGIPAGKPPMPSFAEKLSAEDIENLIGFLGTSD
jgi:mono/diheme cytochrome c family protein